MNTQTALAICSATKYGDRWFPFFRRELTDEEINEARKIKREFAKELVRKGKI